MNIIFYTDFEKIKIFYNDIKKIFPENSVYLTDGSKIIRDDQTIVSIQSIDSYINQCIYLIVTDNEIFYNMCRKYPLIINLVNNGKIKMVVIATEELCDDDMKALYEKSLHIKHNINYDNSHENVKIVREILWHYKMVPNHLLQNWNYPDSLIIEKSPKLEGHKFFNRQISVRDNWNRILKCYPEAFHNNNIKFLDLSCGNGILMECFRFLGHDTFGVDYLSKNHVFDKPNFTTKIDMPNKWIYQILLESQDLKYIGFDLNVLSYPFETDSYDIVNCWGAIEFYANPKYWIVLILEMLRICKLYTFVVFNAIPLYLHNDQNYVNAYNEFFDNINDINRYGIVVEKISYNTYKFYKTLAITDDAVKSLFNSI